jgi:hypothetical protein
MLNRLLFWLSMGIAAALAMLVIFAPEAESWFSSRFVSVFAQDRTLRKTAVASAVGLWVTAFVFFRGPRAPKRLRPEGRQRLPPPTGAGA